MAEPGNTYDEDSDKPVIRPDLLGTQDTPEQDGSPLTPEEIKEREDAIGTPMSKDDIGIANQLRGQQAEDREYNQLAGGLSDQLGSGFSKEEVSKAKSLLKNKGVLAGIGGAVTTLAIGLSMFGLFNNFKLDHFLQNIDVRTFSRFNASFSGRSDAYLRAYLKVRMMEFNGDSPGDKDGNLYFRSGKVDNDSPFADWYRTMRTSDFEKDLLEKNGISFTSAVVPNGNGGFTLKAGKITIKDDPIDYNVQARLPKSTFDDLTSGDPTRLSSALNAIGPDMDKFVNVELFESNKATRKEIRTVARNNTRFFQVIKQRQIRKNIQNQIGVRDWTFFEKTVEKYQQKKTNVQQKILTKVFPADTEVAKFMRCIFVGECNTKLDPANTVGSNDTVDTNTPSDEDTKDETGKVNPDAPTDLGGDELTQQAEQAITAEATDELSQEVTDQIETGNTTMTQRIVQRIVTQMLGEAAADTATTAVGNVGAVWKIAKKLARLDGLISNGTIVKMITAAKLFQDMRLYTMLSTGRDQMKVGDVTAAEVKDLMKTINGFDNSEGWSKLSNFSGGNGSITSPEKEKYCSGGHKKLKDEYAWFCDDQKPNNGGQANTVTDVYNKSVGYIVHPIAVAVNSVKKIPGVEFVTNFMNSVTGAVASVTIDPILQATGITDNVGKVMSFGMEKFLTFAGVVPQWTGSGEPGVGNFALAGSAGVAENSTRLGGGVASTPVTLSYTTRLATNYNHEQQQSQSIFSRYASLNNPTSFVSKSLFAATTMNMQKSVRSFGSIFTSLPSLFGNIFSGRIFAATNDNTAALNQWAGVATYDIPQACQDLDPLLPTASYLQGAIGVEASSPWATQATEALNAARADITLDTARDEGAFWNIIYNKIGQDDKDAESIAGAIYNCALLDRQVQGGMGYLYGYTDDGGLN